MVIYVVAKGKEGLTATGNMAANGYGDHSPGGYSLCAVIVAEVILTGVFLLVILGSTDDRAPKGFAGLSIGLTLTLIHLISIPISNTSVNPARSTGVAFFNGDGAPAQLWVFWLAPLLGRRDRGHRLPVPVRPQRGTRRPAGPRRRPGEHRYYLTGAFFLALLAAPRSVRRTAVGQLPTGVLQVGAHEPLELLQLAGVADEDVLRHQVEILQAVDALAECPRSRRYRRGRAPPGAPARCRGLRSSRPTCGP